MKQSPQTQVHLSSKLLISQSHASDSLRRGHGEDDLVRFKLSSRTEKKGVMRDFECGQGWSYGPILAPRVHFGICFSSQEFTFGVFWNQRVLFKIYFPFQEWTFGPTLAPKSAHLDLFWLQEGTKEYVFLAKSWVLDNFSRQKVHFPHYSLLLDAFWLWRVHFGTYFAAQEFTFACLLAPKRGLLDMFILQKPPQSPNFNPVKLLCHTETCFSKRNQATTGLSSTYSFINIWIFLNPTLKLKNINVIKVYIQRLRRKEPQSSFTHSSLINTNREMNFKRVH